MTLIFKVDNQTIRAGQSWRNSDGVLHPSTWNLWSDEEKEAAGIIQIVLQPLPDERLYTSYHNEDGTVNQTAKALEDSGSGDTLVKGVKTTLKQEVKSQQWQLLAQTDWVIIRKADAGTAVPSDIQTWRDAIRAKATEMEEAIDNAADTDAVATLFVVWDSDENKTGILYDWPELVT
jgi:hypothetical protein